MTLDPATEPAIDTSLTHYLEARALDVALAKAASTDERARIMRLAGLRETLMQRRAALLALATAKRHARGEVYSKARVAAINAMGSGQAELDALADTLYVAQADARAVLEAHARTHFGHGLVAQRLLLSSHTPDVIDDARAMQADEEAFARAWVAAIGDDAFVAEMRRLQRETLAMLRTATRPMHLIQHPGGDAPDDAGAAALGKAWSKLDALAQRLGAEPLSGFIAFDEEGASGARPAREVLVTVQTLIAAIEAPGPAFPAKRATLAVLGTLRERLAVLDAHGGCAHFEVDV